MSEGHCEASTVRSWSSIPREHWKPEQSMRIRITLPAGEGVGRSRTNSPQAAPGGEFFCLSWQLSEKLRKNLQAPQVEVYGGLWVRPSESRSYLFLWLRSKTKWPLG